MNTKPEKAKPTSLCPAWCAAAVAGLLCGAPAAAWAQEQAPQTDTPPTLQLPMTTLNPNPKPVRFDVGGYGPLYVTGILTGFGQVQSNHTGPDHRWRFDVDNGQVFLNKPDGLVQFFVQFGYFSIPALGTPYLPANDATATFYKPVPQAWLKLAPNDNFSVMIGKLPTLVGLETTFSYQNMNIERGLLWGQENAVNRGVQANYTRGPMTFSLSVNDGYYSTHPTWVSGLASYALDKSNTLTFVGAGNTSTTDVASTRTPLLQNNGQIYNLIYTRTDGPWTLTPYLQYSHVPRLPEFGVNGSASTWGGAVLASYDFGADAVPAGWRLPGFKLSGRVEYLASTGNPAGGAPNLLYGPGSDAWSLTLTPSYQYKNLFARGELSWVGTHDAAPGAAFGADGNKGTRVRGVVELGLLF